VFASDAEIFLILENVNLVVELIEL